MFGEESLPGEELGRPEMRRWDLSSPWGMGRRLLGREGGSGETLSGGENSQRTGGKDELHLKSREVWVLFCFVFRNTSVSLN